MNKVIFSILLILTYSISYGQEILYVNADNGLIIREKPSKNSKRLGKFKYAEKIEVQEKTNINFSIVDNEKKINGSWLKVQGIMNNKVTSGYVFSGFLIDEILKKRIEIKFNDFTVELDHIDLMGDLTALSKKQKDTAKISLDLSGTPENKFLKILSKKYKKIEVFQRYENSITIMDEGPHCDLTEWKHFYSEWKKLPYDSNKNSFKTFKYSEKDWKNFIPIKINELKSAVDKFCGQRWSDLLKNIKKVNEYPSGVSMSKIFLKIILTDKDNIITEKIIEFEIPMGC
ncbi:SH3 domain-containing protein [uncultured Lacinutrix sp.]|uniref:SH3 domain-containing protein n=1 Tax=uncultured Lacinutrix sp. TaxID=574032 RepID=UPI0026082AB8|nr:SH3 domain-containing protein [uncultured Lacinutrix sp.]